MPVPEKVLELVERYRENAVAYRSGHYNETQVRREFIDPFFKALGWDIDNEGGASEPYKDVIHEDAIKIGGAHKAPDYGFRVGGGRKFFVEAKKPSVNVQDNTIPAFQLRRYAWSANLPLSILTDFEELAVYDCRSRPEKTDKAATARILFLTYDQYPERWGELAAIFSKDAVLRGSFDHYADATKTKRGSTTVDAAFLKDIESWREALAHNLALRNLSLNQRHLNFAVQMTIDRIIFLRMAEDRGIEEYGRLQALLKGANVYERLCDLYREADDRYNSGLFHFSTEKNRPEPDNLTPGLSIDDKTIQDIIKSLYYPDSPYEFSVLPVDVLGQVYEQFLGKVIHLSHDQVVVEEKPEVRKAGGVYYTPTYIVDYIVRNTISSLLEGKRPGPRGGVSRLKILDPACGSGSFLIGAYDCLLSWHRDRYIEDGPEKHAAELYQGPGGQWLLTTQEKKRILLNNIYGVDIDSQAVEVTKLSLLLKVLEGESGQSLITQLRLFHERALPDLNNNIKCGNSLVEPDFYNYEQLTFLDEDTQFNINAFDWLAQFPDVFRGNNPGFDAVIGNPPYIFTRELISKELRTYYSSKFHASWEKQNTFMLFMELMLRLLNKSGKGSFIVPNSWLTIESAHLLRELFVPKLEIISDLNYTVFTKVSMEPCIFTISGSDLTSNVLTLRADSRENLLKSEGSLIDRNRWSPPDRRIVFSDSLDSAGLVDNIVRTSTSIGEIFDVRSGLQAYERGRGNPPQTADDVENHVFDRNEREDDHSYRYLEGMDVGRYRLKWSGLWLQYGPWLAQPREFGIFSRPRILLREITSGLPNCLNATLVTDEYLNNKSILNVLHPKDDPAELKCLLAILNSRVTSIYYKDRAVKSTRRIFPKVVIKNLREFPYPPLVPDDKRVELVRLVDSILNMHRRLDELRTGYELSNMREHINFVNRQIDQVVAGLFGVTADDLASGSSEGPVGLPA